MKPTMFISSVMSKISLPQRRLEAAANCSRSPGQNTLHRDLSLKGYENVDWKFLTVSGNGNVQMVFSSKQDNKIICVEIPAAANFLAVFTKGQSAFFKFEFGISLS